MKKLIVLGIAIISLSFSLVAQNVESGLIDAVTLYTNGNYKDAQRILLELNASDPKSDAVWYYLSKTQILGGDVEGAHESLQMAVALDSTNIWYRRSLARLLLNQGNLEEGKAMYEALLKSFPKDQSLPYELLQVYLSAKDYDKALESLEDIERQQGPSEQLASTRYDIYNAMGRPDKAIETLEDFNSKYSSTEILSILGDAYLADFADSLAGARYQEALSLDNSYMPAIVGMSEVYRHKRNYPEYFKTLEIFAASQDVNVQAKSYYIDNIGRTIDPKTIQAQREGFDRFVGLAIESSPADTTLYTSAGRYFYSTGRPEISETYFLKAAQLEPGSITLTATYLQVLAAQSKWEQVRDSSIVAFRRFQELAFVDYSNMANFQLGDYDSIITNCRFLIKNYPKNKEIQRGAWSTMGDAYGEQKDFKQACKAYDNVLKIDPDHIPTLNNYAYYLCLQGKKLKKAYTMSKKTIEAEPDNATYLDTFAWILHLMGKDLEAKPFFKHAMLYGGKDSAVILIHYATVLEALGETDAANVYRNMAGRLEQ